ncbi:MAG: sodium:proton antiporter NhaD, partial [Pseudomonadales bacterium]|nr:sodium:proton antiporter NhaD [Pseudomonadales bacterium]
MNSGFLTLITVVLAFTPISSVFASSGAPAGNLNMTGATIGIVALVLFCAAYALVIAEEFIHLRKSKPVIAAAGIIWVLVALAAQQSGAPTELVESALSHNLLEFSALLLFLLTAMVYVNAMTERNVFETLRATLVKKGFSYRQLFWITGFLAFFISPIADNLTTALLMGAV